MRRIVVLSGGVGGARLVEGLARVAKDVELTVVVNTGDDFEHWGLRVCPDVDTVLYHLSGDVDWARGWGVRDDATTLLDQMRRLGQPDWFLLGDRDLAMHVARTHLLARGRALTDVTAELALGLGVATTVLPMCDQPAPTYIQTDDAGTLVDFQTWFVRQRCAPAARGIALTGGAPSPQVVDALVRADALIIAPSNPFVSIEPILALDGVASLVARLPRVGVSPIVGGRAVKGPLAEMLRDIAQTEPSPGAVFARYGGVDIAVVADGDGGAGGGATIETQVVMRSSDDRAALARVALDAALSLVDR